MTGVTNNSLDVCKQKDTLLLAGIVSSSFFARLLNEQSDCQWAPVLDSALTFLFNLNDYPMIFSNL